MKQPCIGILAGMGPRSTAPFVDMVVEECALQYGATFDMDFPAMLIYSLPTPFYPGEPLDHEAMRGSIMSGLKELAGFGADHIAIPCNIAHLYYDELKRSVEVPLLNIVDETVSRIPGDCHNVALFAARGTAEAGLYQRGLESRGKSAVLKPKWQNDIDKLIMSVKKNGASSENIPAMAALLSEAGRCADCAIIGCTDLTPLALNCGSDMGITDSARCLAAAAVALYLALKE